MWGVAPRPGRGGAANATPENGERRTENAASARRRNCSDEEIVGVWGGAPPRKPSLQASKLPSFHLPLHPRHVCDVPSRRPQEMQEIQERPCGVTDGVPEKAIRRETEGGGRGQRRSRRATDGGRSGSRPPLRLCGFNCPRTLLMHTGERILV